jgi:hypothetical protein
VPGEIMLIAAAIFAGAGQMNIAVVFVVAVLAAVIGDNIGFIVGHFGGRPLAERFGRYVFLTPERLDRTENNFNSHGGKIVTVARFIDGYGTFERDKWYVIGAIAVVVANCDRPPRAAQARRTNGLVVCSRGRGLRRTRGAG